MFNKITFVLFLLTSSLFSQESNYKNYLPFKYDNLWGIVDSTQNVVLKPSFNNIDFVGDLDYVVLDNAVLFDLNKGISTKALGRFTNELTVDGKIYSCFLNEQETVLINHEQNDTIRLQDKYEKLYNIFVQNPMNKASIKYIYGEIETGLGKLYFNNRKLALVTPTAIRNLDFINDNDSSNYVGYVFDLDDYKLIYTYEGKQIAKKPKDTSTENMLKIFSEITGVKNIDLNCFNCDVPFMAGMRPRQYDLPKPFDVEYMNGKSIVSYRKKRRKKKILIEKPIVNKFKGVRFFSFSGKAFIIDHRYVKDQKLMYPIDLLD